MWGKKQEKEAKTTNNEVKIDPGFVSKLLIKQYLSGVSSRVTVAPLL